MLPRGLINAPLVPTHNFEVKARSDLGPGSLDNVGQNLSDAVLANVVATGEPALAIPAEIARTQSRVNANFQAYPFTITPPFAVHPATVVVMTQQLLTQNLKRKSLYYLESQSAARAASGVTASGILFQAGPAVPQVQNGSDASPLLAQALQTSFLTAQGGVSISAPAPTNAITVIAQWGPPAVAGSPASPLVGVIIDAS